MFAETWASHTTFAILINTFFRNSCTSNTFQSLEMHVRIVQTIYLSICHYQIYICHYQILALVSWTSEFSFLPLVHQLFNCLFVQACLHETYWILDLHYKLYICEYHFQDHWKSLPQFIKYSINIFAFYIL